MIDSTINLQSIITVIMVGVGAIVTFVTVRNNVNSMKGEMVDLKQEVKKLADVLISVARQEERMTAMDQRMTAQGHRLDELRSTQARLEGGRFDQLCDRLNSLVISLETR